MRVYTVCHSVCIVWTHYSIVDPHSSNFRAITTKILGVRIFRKPTVQLMHPFEVDIRICQPKKVMFAEVNITFEVDKS